MAMSIKPTGRVVEIFTGTSLTSAATAVSSGIDVTNASYFGLWIKASSAGASGVTGVRVWYEQSYDDTTGDYVVPDGVTSTLTGAIVANVPRIVSIAPLPMEYLRFKATCTTAISADAVLTVKMFTQ